MFTKNKKEIDEDKIYEFFRKRINASPIAKIRRFITSKLGDGIVKFSIIGAIIFSFIFIVSLVRVGAPIGFGVWSEQNRANTSSNQTEENSLTALYRVADGVISAIASIEVFVIAFIIILIVLIERFLRYISKQRNKRHQRSMGFQTGIAQKDMLDCLHRHGKINIAQTNVPAVIQSILKAISAEVDDLHPLQEGDISNVSFFLYEDGNAARLISRTQNVENVGVSFDRANIVGHYATLCGNTLNVYNFRSLPFKFDALTSALPIYQSVLSVPCPKMGDAREYIGFVTIDSAKPFHFVGIRDEVLNRIQAHIGLISAIFKNHGHSETKRES